MPSPDHHDTVSSVGNFRDELFRIPADERLAGIREDPRKSADADPCNGEASEQRADSGQAACCHQYLPVASTPELITVTPCGELRPERFTDPHQGGAVAELRETDVVGRYALPCIAVQLLRLFDRFPAFLERREVPALTLRAHHP